MAHVQKYLSAIAVDPANILAGAIANVDIVVGVGNVKVGDFIDGQPPDTLEAGLIPIAFTCPVDGTVRIRLFNSTAGAIDGASRNWNFMVTRLGAPGGEGIGWAG